MKRLLGSLVQRALGGQDRLATRPLLVGYRKEMAPVLRFAIFCILAAAAFVYGLAFAYLAPATLTPLVGPIALLSGLVIWLLPPGDYAPTRLIEPIFMAFFVALIIWPNYLAISLPGLPWLTMLRIIGVPLVVILFICISVSTVFRSRLWEVLNTDKAILWLLIAVVVIQTVTLPLSRDLGASINRWIIAQTNWTSIFVVSCVVFMRPRFAEYWVKVLILMLFVICGFGIWENQLGRLPWAGHIPPMLKIEDEAVQRILGGASRAAIGVHRVQGTSTTPLGLAELLGLAIPFALHLCLGQYRLVSRLLGLAFIPVAVTVILYTDSRLGMVAALASAILYLLIWGLIRWRQNQQSIIGPAIVVAYPVIFTAFVAATFFIGRLRAQVWGDGSQAASTEGRIRQWEIGLPKVLNNPFGYGIGQSAEVLGVANGLGVITIDTYYLSILLELGFIGFIAYYGLFLRSIWVGASAVVKYKGDSETRLLLPLSVSLMDYVIVKSVFSQDANHPLVFMMLGAVVALTYRATKVSDGPTRP
jgi:hypothetical protein